MYVSIYKLYNTLQNLESLEDVHISIFFWYKLHSLELCSHWYLLLNKTRYL